MPKSLTQYRVFIASPRGLEEERRGFSKVISDYNESEANHRGVHFSPVGWEITLGAVGRPQEIINREIETCDYFVLLLHDRWGSPPSYKSHGDAVYSSGTEEEFHIALACYEGESRIMRQIVMFFKAVSERQLSDPGDQLQRVLNFRKEREEKKDFLFHTFDSVDNFKELLRRHLAQWTRDHERGEVSRVGGPESTLKVPPERLDLLKASVSSRPPQILRNMLETAEQLAAEGRILDAEIKFSQIAVTTEDPWVMARYGRFLGKIGQLHRAKEILERAIELARSAPDSRIKAYAVRQLGHIFERSGQPVEATEVYFRSLALYDSIGDAEGRASCLLALGLVLRKRGMLKEALHHFTSAVNIYTEIGDQRGKADALGYLGLVYRTRGEFDKAERAHLEALGIHEAKGARESAAADWSNLGVIYRTQGRLKEAEGLHEKALRVYEELGNQQGLAREYSNLGAANRLLGQLDRAEEMHLNSLRISESMGNKQGMAIQLSNLGRIARELGKFDEAREFHAKSLQLSEELGDTQGVAMQFESLGVIARDSGELDRGEEFLRKALEINRNVDSRFGTATTSLELGKLMIQRGRDVEGRVHIEEARRMFVEMNLEAETERIDRLLAAMPSEAGEPGEEPGGTRM